MQAANAGLFALGGTRSFILGRERIVVVDPGPDDPEHLERLATEVSTAREGLILLTHRHPDHAAGAPALARRTGFPVRGTPPARDGDEHETDEGTLLVVATPGHARDHLAFFLVERRTLLVGDLLLGEGDTTWVGEYPGCVGDYLRSLDRIEALEPRRLLPAHGPPIDDAREAIRRFRSHRLERIAAVEAALRAMERDAVGQRPRGGEPAPPDVVERLVHRVYGPELPQGLRVGAAWSVRAILDHLGAAPFPSRGAPTEGGDRLAPPS